MTAAATERVGRYQLLEPIGVGPSGSVSRAKVFGVAGFERQFAIKRFHPELTATSVLAQALSVAARAYGSLEHPRIARMSEFGVAQGTTFTAVEFVSGLDALRLIAEARMAGQPLAAGGALALVSQAARAVGYAHGRGLTHLGLAPTNVMITAEGDIKITDFGILSATLPQRPVDVARLTNRIPYLAPEQLANEATSAATDVFALGVLAYELVTGHRTFRGETPQQIAQSVMAGPPIEPPLPRPIVRVLQRCLARSPFERFPDARALADALDAALRVAPVPGTRKDIGAQVKATMERIAQLSEGELSGMLALNVGTGPLPRSSSLGVAPAVPLQAPIAAASVSAPAPASAPAVPPLAAGAQAAHDGDFQTNEFLRAQSRATPPTATPTAPTTPAASFGPGALLGAARSSVDSPASTVPDLKPAALTTVPGLPPPPIPVPPGVAPPPIPPPPGQPVGTSTLLGFASSQKPPPIPSLRPPTAPSSGPTTQSLAQPAGARPGFAPASVPPVAKVPNVAPRPGTDPPARAGTEPPAFPSSEITTNANARADATYPDERPTTPLPMRPPTDLGVPSEPATSPDVHPYPLAESDRPTMRARPLDRAPNVPDSIEELAPPPSPAPAAAAPVTVAESPFDEPELIEETVAEPAAAPPPRRESERHRRETVRGDEVIDDRLFDPVPAAAAHAPVSAPVAAAPPAAPAAEAAAAAVAPAELAEPAPAEPSTPAAAAYADEPPPRSSSPFTQTAAGIAPPAQPTFPTQPGHPAPPPAPVAPPPMAYPSAAGLPRPRPSEDPAPSASAAGGPPRSKLPLILGGTVAAAGLAVAGWFAYGALMKDSGEPSTGSAVATHPPQSGDGSAGSAGSRAAESGSAGSNGSNGSAGSAVASNPGNGSNGSAAPTTAPSDAGVASAGTPTAPPDAAAKPTGELTIASTPAGARVFLDGADAGVTPLKLPGTPDRHTIALLLAGHELYVAQVDGNGQFEIPMKEVTPSGGPAGIKVIKCKDKERYYVFVDGKPTGQTCPTERIETTLGPHTVEIYDVITETRRKWEIVVKETRLSHRVRIDP